MDAEIDKRSAKVTQFVGRHFLKECTNAEKFRLRLAVSAGVLATVLMLFQWLMFAFIAENVIVEKQSLLSHKSVIALLFIVILGRSLLVRLQTHFSQSASTKIRANIRHVLLNQWRLISPVELRNTSIGIYATQFIEDVEAMDGYFSRYWPQQALAIISPLLILCVVAYLNWLCALLLFISAPLIPIFMILVGMGAENLNQKYSTIRQRLSGHFLDRVANLFTIRILGAQSIVLQEVRTYSDTYRNVIMKTLKVAFLSSTVLEFFTSIAIAALAIYIGFSLYGAITWGPAASLSLSTGLSILILAPEFFQPLRTLSQYYHDRASALGAANNLVERLGIDERVFRLSKLAKDEQVETSSQVTKQLTTSKENQKARLTLTNLSVGYCHSAPLLKQINLKLSTGDTLVITGQSGSGKSSLLNTIAGYLPAMDGSIVYQLSVKPSMSYLPQSAWIKNASIYENLIVLAPNATHSEMLKVLEQLGLAEELDLKHNGLDTLLGEHGQGLSGGQMQRIALARVLLNPAPVVLLDEPTAKLDEDSKLLVINALLMLKTKVIMLISSHDPAVMAIGDISIDLNGGAKII